MRHRISAGVLTVHDGKILLVRHFRAGLHDFWAPPGGGVEGGEELADAAEREALEETGLVIAAGPLAYIDELIDDSERMIKFWFLARYVSGVIDVDSNPAEGESIIEAGWFARNSLPEGYVFPDPLHDRFWQDLATGFPAPIKLPLKRALF
ncbi:NUDIX domain-containing protein [Devosia sp. SL43]|uniref:NUDIX domain-containing protein n=1 Tax=Devosia sp. SL43 TaxID=2806348 RepID=UPI001F1A844F|nr:NUDIX hydrolase [Devosia sp. SL43]UJW84386.1 NUDIX hydrolase [Devosia sp. SL43]